MTRDRASLEVDTLLKVILLLVAAVLVLEILGEIVSLIPAFLSSIVTLAIALVIVLWLLDRL
ncbi:DUF7554 family protein [Halovivax cerinus]|uniref:Uncharacterized protein n=1 Tax=Halovivax cerinus TaxID=1487865 RepID=A0ABD5NL65_9EURY|nr:hypothetical protein [Halovivax cerinus]